MENTKTFGLGASYFIGVSALLYLSSRIYWHFFFKEKKRQKWNKNTTTTKGTGSLKRSLH